ncbi:MAG: hypothetical protein MZV65_52455 [Chromatiales bacterium]|nr:hypothetical protein [Chromatiales bacterium]
MTPRARVRAAACVARARSRPSCTAAGRDRAQPDARPQHAAATRLRQRGASTPRSSTVKVGDVTQAQAVLRGRADATRASRASLHIDLQRVQRRPRRSACSVPLHFINAGSVAGREAAGRHRHRTCMTEVEIACLPKDLPEFIDGRPVGPRA